MLLAILIIVLCIFLLYLYFKFFRILRINCLAMFTGAPKTGKSTLSIYTAVRLHKKQVRRTKLRNFILFWKPKLELPLLYSNIPLNVPHVLVTDDLLTRKTRFVYGSVIYLGEVSLVSNSMSFSSNELNERILMFYKLIGHETKGGYLIVDTQSIQDVHYGIKRSVSEYYHILHCYKLPLCPFVLLKLKLLTYSEDNSSINVNDTEADDNTKFYLVPKKTWKVFDAYAYSFMTDNLPVISNINSNGTGSKFEVVSFNRYKTLYKGDTENE